MRQVILSVGSWCGSPGLGRVHLLRVSQMVKVEWDSALDQEITILRGKVVRRQSHL